MSRADEIRGRNEHVRLANFSPEAGRAVMRVQVDDIAWLLDRVEALEGVVEAVRMQHYTTTAGWCVCSSGTRRPCSIHEALRALDATEAKS